MIISTPLVLDHYMCNNDTQLFIDKFNSCPSISFSYFTDNEKHTKFYDDLKNILSLKYASEPETVIDGIGDFLSKKGEMVIF